MAKPDPTDCCPGCGVQYKDFRTGFSFGGVQEMMWSPSENSEEWRSKRRSGVLGYWMQLKQDMWRGHQRECRPQHDDHIPF